MRVKLEWADVAVLRALATGAHSKAVTRALRMAGRDGGKALRAAANRAVRSRKRLPVAVINKAVRPVVAAGKTIQDLAWSVRVVGRPQRVSDYKYRQVRRGVSVAINKDKPRSLIKGAFVARVGGHTGVFRRAGTARLPIEQLYSSRVTDVLKDPGTTPAVLGRGREVFDKTFKRVLPLELKKRST